MTECMDNGEKQRAGCRTVNGTRPFHGAGPGEDRRAGLVENGVPGHRAPGCAYLQLRPAGVVSYGGGDAASGSGFDSCCFRLGFHSMALHVADSNAILSASPRIPLRRSLAA